MKPCRRGHDRDNPDNVYVYTHPYTGKVVVICKVCQKENYTVNAPKYNKARCKLWADKRY